MVVVVVVVVVVAVVVVVIVVVIVVFNSSSSSSSFSSSSSSILRSIVAEVAIVAVAEASRPDIETTTTHGRETSRAGESEAAVTPAAPTPTPATATLSESTHETIHEHTKYTQTSRKHLNHTPRVDTHRATHTVDAGPS